uniref:Heme-binding protein n=1 Tax=Alexandrium monilatum TaxID=311494 RepID=A0A7S4SWS8_9DINO|mmetsp:Transcript_7376/g.23241  ORF Transcript_7376/g.23241 Transcript_7376/m.23241 type:complete len:149 (+) Transcript_7376:68-514(+)
MAFAASSAITLLGAKQAAEVGLAEAEKLGLKVAVAVCDAGGHSLVVCRMDGAMPSSSEISMGKARSAVMFARETKQLEGAVNGEKSSGGERAALLSSGYVLMEGGVPITDPASGRIIGACGVSGAKPQEDAAVAKAAVASLGTAASKL